MKIKIKVASIVAAVAWTLGAQSTVFAQSAAGGAAPVKTAATQDPQARALLKAAAAKLQGLRSLTADYESNRAPTKNFDRAGRISLERPNRFRVERVGGAVVEERVLQVLSDGKTVTNINTSDFVAYEKPVHRENFFLGANFLVQFFFDPRGIGFDPSDATWGRAMSVFDANLTAYDKDTRIGYLGERTMEGLRLKVVEIKYNTRANDIRQQVYIGTDNFIYQVDTYFEGIGTYSQKFRNFRANVTLPPETWAKDRIENMPVVAADPVRMGAPAPDFTLPGHDGGEFTLKEMLAGKKGMFICTLNGASALVTQDADTHLPQMRILQELKEKYEKQGLLVVAIVGGSKITPDLKEEMLLNWLPDLSRFDYPVLIDIDLERGLQGSAYQNFRINGRNNILLDAKGRMVFAAKDFDEKVNQLALYQALAQIGFTVSAADMESAAAR